MRSPHALKSQRAAPREALTQTHPERRSKRALQVVNLAGHRIVRALGTAAHQMPWAAIHAIKVLPCRHFLNEMRPCWCGGCEYTAVRQGIRGRGCPLLTRHGIPRMASP